MSTPQLRAIEVGVVFLVIFLSGLWLNRTGKPFNGILLNVHKLIALGTGIFLIVIIYWIGQAGGLSTVEWAAVIVTGVLFLATGIFGGLASIDRPMPTAIVILHRVMPFLTALATALTLYLLLNR